MKTGKRLIWIFIVIALMTFLISAAEAQRQGEMDSGSIAGRVLISNGPKGPIHGGESAVTDMLLIDDGLVYGSTEATWGAQACHLFHTCSKHAEHEINVTEKLPGQVKISDLDTGPGNIIIGGTTTYNKVFDDAKNRYDGGHLFSFDPKTKEFADLGVVSAGQGINCVAVDTLHTRIYCVTCPEGSYAR